MQMTLADINALPADACEALMRTLCGSGTFARLMTAARPFADLTGFEAAAEASFDRLDAADWQEAFAHHPRIGDRAALEQRFGGSGRHSATEQAAVDRAHAETLDALLAWNDRYFERHGHIFIVFATGKSAEEMLELLKGRIDRTVDEENAACAAEQRKITRLRIHKLLGLA
jgi:2-oxo-4-hydroxy-4-carboxy-5-ureidoimidazoline decarboxylase